MRVNYPRSQAVRILTRVLSESQPLDEALAEAMPETAPEARAWLQEVCSGTLRWKGRLDFIIDSTALKKKPTGWLRKVLLIGAYQLIVQERAQPGAVVSETVEEIKRKESEAPAKFANALLRKIADHAAMWREWKPAPEGSPEEFAHWASMPLWFWNKIRFQQGPESAQEFAQACLERPTTWVRARRPDWKPAWAEPGPLPCSWKVTQGGAIPEKEGFLEGEFIVQDISSQILVSEIAREVSGAAGPGAKALDLCAAPGGKAIGLAWSGLEVSATDRDGARTALLRQSIGRTESPEVKSIQVIERSQVAGLPAQDLVWVDAPCTGSGIIRRHPDVRWLRKEDDLRALTNTQGALLREAWEKVRPGGFLAYSVCSVFKDEGPKLVEAAKLPAKTVKEWSFSPAIAPYGDGFWAILLQKS